MQLHSFLSLVVIVKYILFLCAIVTVEFYRCFCVGFLNQLREEKQIHNQTVFYHYLYIYLYWSSEGVCVWEREREKLCAHVCVWEREAGWGEREREKELLSAVTSFQPEETPLVFLIRLVYLQQILSVFAYLEYLYFSFIFLKIALLDIWFFFDSFHLFSTLNMLPHCFLLSVVYDKKSNSILL